MKIWVRKENSEPMTEENKYTKSKENMERENTTLV